MAIYFLHLKNFGRSSGSSAVSAAAYRAGERIRDERTGRTYDHSARRDVLHKEIILPASVAPQAAAWAEDRANLWNSAERAEHRKDARVAREYLVVLPAELGSDQRLRLARDFAYELSERYRFAVDLAVHAPRQLHDSDPRNFHAHLLATTREITAQGLGAKTVLEWSDARRAEAGLGPAINELLYVRERWAVAANSALLAANIDARIDHRTLKAQGVVAPEQARPEQAKRLDPLEDIRREAREAWLKMWSSTMDTSADPEPQRGAEPQRGRDDDLAQ